MMNIDEIAARIDRVQEQIPKLTAEYREAGRLQGRLEAVKILRDMLRASITNRTYRKSDALIEAIYMVETTK